MQLRAPGGGVVAAAIGGGRAEVLQDDRVSLLTQRGQVTDVQLQLAAVLVEVQEGGDDLEDGGFQNMNSLK